MTGGKGTYNTTDPLRNQNTKDIRSFDIASKRVELLLQTGLKVLDKLVNTLVIPEEVSHLVLFDSSEP
ncbi:hypothetical protein GB937_008348 [Aspergillus fischeri]|nr:hypothetical protein GB937_008348 [Aspergillus fischeri]